MSKQSIDDEVTTVAALEAPMCEVSRRNLLAAALGSAAATMMIPSSIVRASSKGDGLLPMASEGQVLPWHEYLTLLEPAGQLAQITLEPNSDLVRAEVYKQLVMNIASGYFMYFQSDDKYPDWMPMVNSVFTLQPNPDDTYWLAPLDDEGIYRVVGTRGTVHILSISLNPYKMGASDELAEALDAESGAERGESNREANNAGYYDGDELNLGPNGEFEVLISRERPKGHRGDWFKLSKGVSSILIRQRSYDWGSEVDARFAIERLDSVGSDLVLKPRMSAMEIDQRLRQLLGGYVERLSRMWIEYQNNVAKRKVWNRFEFTDIGGSVPAQVYWQGMYDLKEDEALILESEMPNRLRYWNIQLNDVLWNSTEFIYRQSSLNGHQAKIDPDGKLRAVIAFRDPGVWNWLDPAGYPQGMAIGRWYGADRHPLPTLIKVPLAKLEEFLPKNMHRITPAQRAEQLRARRIGGQLRRRW